MTIGSSQEGLEGVEIGLYGRRQVVWQSVARAARRARLTVKPRRCRLRVDTDTMQPAISRREVINVEQIAIVLPARFLYPI